MKYVVDNDMLQFVKCGVIPVSDDDLISDQDSILAHCGRDVLFWSTDDAGERRVEIMLDVESFNTLKEAEQYALPRLSDHLDSWSYNVNTCQDYLDEAQENYRAAKPKVDQLRKKAFNEDN